MRQKSKSTIKSSNIDQENFNANNNMSIKNSTDLKTNSADSQHKSKAIDIRELQEAEYMQFHVRKYKFDLKSNSNFTFFFLTS
jgi:hypothetical protein